MKILFINNCYLAHCEIVESIIVKYPLIIKDNVDKIFLNIKEERHFRNNQNFKKYIKSKYPKITFGLPRRYTYFIECTTYEKDYPRIKFRDPNRHFYISHRVCKIFENMKNVYCLTPLAKRYIYCDVLPFSNMKVKKDIPIFCVQGTLLKSRRNYNLLKKILNHKTEYDFRIKMIGRGSLPKELINKKVILRSNLDFIQYHKEFLDCYCLIPLITKKSHPNYYKNQLTSSINYIRGYKLKCLIDKDLQDIYQLEDATIFNNEEDFLQKFELLLKDYSSGINRD
jgi:hypothetical protein